MARPPLEKEPDSWSVPKGLSKPRSVLSSADKLFKAADGFGLMDNPLPSPLRTTVSALGAGFAAANVGAELLDGDWKGAIVDVADGAVSLTGGAKLLGMPQIGLGGMYAAGAALNTAVAFQEIKKGDPVDGYLRIGDAVGMSLVAIDALAPTAIGPAAGPLGLAILGSVGLISVARDVANEEFLKKPDRFG